MSRYSQLNTNPNNRNVSWTRWLNQFMAIVVLLNCLLCLFDLSYLSLRPSYVKYFPAIAQLYDPIKGITPHPQVQSYLNSVDQLSDLIAEENRQPEKTSAQVKALQEQSIGLLDDNTFTENDQTQDLRLLKRLIRVQTQSPTSEGGLARLWDTKTANAQDLSTTLQSFNQNFRPVLNRIYLRDIEQDGRFVNDFWRLDVYFLGIFAIDLLIRTTLTSLRFSHLSWRDALVRRWYDWLLFFPFWRWLRLIPAFIRLNQTNVLSLERLISQVTHEPTAYLSDKVTKFMLVRLINQLQTTLNEGNLLDLWPQSENYVQLGQANKIDRIVDRLLQITIYRVLPEVQPNTQELLRHSVKEALKQSEFAQGVSLVPGVSDLSIDAIDQMSSYLSVEMYKVLAESYADEEGKEIVDSFTEQFRQTLRQQLQTQPAQSELKQLLSNALEEFKINYLQRTEKIDPGKTLSEVDKLKQKLE